jgi:hypothetical protein
MNRLCGGLGMLQSLAEIDARADMVCVPGGLFRMGSNNHGPVRAEGVWHSGISARGTRGPKLRPQLAQR